MVSKKLGIFALLSIAALGATDASAGPIVAPVSGPLSVTDSNLATAGTAGSAWSISQSFTTVGPAVVALSDVDGVPLGTGVDGFTSGSWITTTIVNNSDTVWTSFEFELQEALGTPSSDMDGLSFAQRSGSGFWSSAFSSVARIDVTRDYLNFTGGSVGVGQSVTFAFAVTDMTPVNPIYLVQTANKVANAARESVPEPGLMTLLGTGLVGMLVRRRRT